jgi:tetratricopeptide (TPR) repeat protein
MMNSLPAAQLLTFEDARHAQASEGWLVLGDLQEAKDELDQVSPKGQQHPFVMEVRWRLNSAARNWEACLEISEALVKMNPGESQHWILLAYAKRRSSAGGLEAAHEVLINSQKTFPDEPLIAFNLACYNAQLGKLDTARDWLNSALSLGKAINSGFEKELKAMSLEDPDLEPLRESRKQAHKSGKVT